MDDDIPVVVRMRVECASCAHAEDDTYEFDLPLAKAQPRVRAAEILLRKVVPDLQRSELTGKDGGSLELIDPTRRPAQTSSAPCT
jgi:hypothetical protein